MMLAVPFSENLKPFQYRDIKIVRICNSIEFLLRCIG